MRRKVRQKCETDIPDCSASLFVDTLGFAMIAKQAPTTRSCSGQGEGPIGLHFLQGRNPAARDASIVSKNITLLRFGNRDRHSDRQATIVDKTAK